MKPELHTVIVVLNWCGEEDTTDCLRSLGGQRAEGVEILLVDNASPDGSGERLHRAFPDVPYLQTDENLGYGGGNNAGLRWARERGARRALVLNNDTVVEPCAVSRMVETLEETPGAGAVVPRIVYDDDPERIWYGGERFSPLHGLGLHEHEGRAADPHDVTPRPVTFMTGCACLLSLDAIDDVGGFAEDFFAYAEDAELSVRLVRAGYSIVYEPRATVRHRTPRLGEPPSPFQIRLRDRNRRRLMRRHFGLARRVPFLAHFYLTRMVHLGRFLARGDGARAAAILRGMWER